MPQVLTKNELWPEDPRAGTLVPLTRDQQGALHPAWPNALRSAVNGVNELLAAPKAAVEGKYTPAEMRDVGTRMALTLAGLGLGAPAEENTLKMFGGVKAKTADMPKLTHALGLEGRGSSPEEIWNTTGWFRGPDNKWRFEIPDNNAWLHPGAFAEHSGLGYPQGNIQLDKVQKLTDIMHHPDLFSAYPQLKKIDLVPTPSGPGTGVYHSTEKQIGLDIGDYQTSLSTLLHEGQHGVQDIEHFAEGGSPEQFLSPDFLNQHFLTLEKIKNHHEQMKAVGADPKFINAGINASYRGEPIAPSVQEHLDRVNALVPELLPEYLETSQALNLLNKQKSRAHEMYRNLAGEAEAFNVQERHATGDYGTFPPATPGYPPYAQQSVWLGGREQPRLLQPVEHDPFAQAPMPSLLPVEHDPWQHTAEPVSHDPFATEETKP